MQEATEDPSRAATLPYEEVAESLAVRLIATPMDQIIGFDSDEPLTDAIARLQEAHIDYAPVFEGGTLVGRIARGEQFDGNRRVVDALERLRAVFLISADSPISSAMRWLAKQPWLLLVDGNSVAGVVTPADLNHQAVRVYFYMLIADFEIRLASLLREHSSDETKLLEALGAASQDVSRRFEQLTAQDIQTDLIGAMQLKDLIKIAGKTPDIRDALRYSTRSQWEADTGRIVDFRNQIMHPTRPLVDSRASHARLVEMDSRLRTLLSRFPR